MSELTPCNYCTYQALKRRYGARNITTAPGFRPSADRKLDRKFAAAFGPGVTVRLKKTGETLAWFMVLPERCAC